MADPPGPLLARGRAADVFDLGGGRVLRRYRRPPDRPGWDEAVHRQVSSEAELMARLEAAGYPVPHVYDVSGGDLVLERIAGPTMLQALGSSPWRVRSCAGLLADLHQRLHEIPADGGAILHLDLHPENVILAPRGPVVIDWTNAEVGAPEVDVAQTWLIVDTSEPDRAAGLQLRLLLLGRRLFLDRFLAAFDRAAVASRLPEVAERRLADPNVTEVERARLRRFLRPEH